MRPTLTSLSTALLLGILALAQPASADGLLAELDKETRALAARLAPSVVHITVEHPLYLGPERPMRQETVALSGVVVRAEGYIVSLGKVYEQASRVEVRFHDGHSRPAEVVGVDPETFLALLKVTPPDGGLTPVTVGDPGTLAPGAIVVAVGNPFGLPHTTTLGNVSGMDRVLQRGQAAFTGVIQMTCPVNPGDPGGLLADARGRAVGILASTYQGAPSLDLDPATLDQLDDLLAAFLQRMAGMGPKDAEHPIEILTRLVNQARDPSGGLFGQDLSFALPMDQVMDRVERLRTGELHPRGYLGLQVVDLDAMDATFREYLELEEQEGALVVGVMEEGPAFKAGIRRYDLILRFKDGAVRQLGDLRTLVEATRPGDQVEVQLLRGQKQLAVSLTMEARPSGLVAPDPEESQTPERE